MLQDSRVRIRSYRGKLVGKLYATLSNMKRYISKS